PRKRNIMATASPKPKRRPTVWPARIGIVIALAVAAALTGFLFIPGVGSLVAPIFGEVGDTGPLALSSLFLTGVLALGAIIGWRDPYNPDPLPSADRIEMGNKPTAGLRA